MNELAIPNKPRGFKLMSIVFGNGKNTNSRNSRDVHKYMNVKTDYSDWIKRRIDALGAEENIDFVVLKNGDGKFTKIDYIITDDFAKHLGMVEKNDKGKEVRNYFIYMEKLAKFLVLKECDINKSRLETALTNLKIAQQNNRKIYKDGFVSLNKYVNDRELNLSRDQAFGVLLTKGLLEYKEVVTNRLILLDETLGRQIDNGVIEFNSRALDSIFSDFVHKEPSLFDDVL